MTSVARTAMFEGISSPYRYRSGDAQLDGGNGQAQLCEFGDQTD